MAGTHAAYTLAALPTCDTPALEHAASNLHPDNRTQRDQGAHQAGNNPPTHIHGNRQPDWDVNTNRQWFDPHGIPHAYRNSHADRNCHGNLHPNAGTAPVWDRSPGCALWARAPGEQLTNEMVYISFHCTLENGLTSYLEYPVYSRLTVSIPAGPCHYVAWVKGIQFIGDIRIKKLLEYTFTFKKQKILISQP